MGFPMPKVEKVSIALTPEMASLVREAVDGGDYASASEVIRDALREWKQLREQRGKAIEEIGRLWDEGRESGPGRLASLDEIRAEARSRLADSTLQTE